MSCTETVLRDLEKQRISELNFNGKEAVGNKGGSQR